MKLTCDLCGGTLQMNAGGKDASCKNCGLCYPMDVLREKLGLCAAAKSPEPVKPAEPEVVAPAVFLKNLPLLSFLKRLLQG